MDQCRGLLAKLSGKTDPESIQLIDSLELKVMNLQQQIKETESRNIFFFDESRFGTHSKLGHGWFLKGLRTGVKVKLGFKNFYVYSAVDMRSGEDFLFIVTYGMVSCGWYREPVMEMTALSPMLEFPRLRV